MQLDEDEDAEALRQQSEAYLARVLNETGVALGPKPQRVDDAYADARIREKLAHFGGARQRAGLWSVNESLKNGDVPPSLRLHLISAVAHLGRIGKDTLDDRRARSGAREPRD